jgi:hypothetical protein
MLLLSVLASVTVRIVSSNALSSGSDFFAQIGISAPLRVVNVFELILLQLRSCTLGALTLAVHAVFEELSAHDCHMQLFGSCLL